MRVISDRFGLFDAMGHSLPKMVSIKMIDYVYEGMLFTIDASLVPKDSLLNIIHRKAISNGQDVKYSNADGISTINELLIPINSLLDIIRKHSEDSIHVSLDKHLHIVIDYVKNKPIVTDQSLINILEYWGVYRSYDTIYKDEKYMKVHMYEPEFIDYNMNIDKYYNLMRAEIFSDTYNELTTNYIKPDNLLFDQDQLDNIPLYTQVVDNLISVSFLFDLAKSCSVNIFIAGGHVFKALMGLDGKYKSDIDIFFVNSNRSDVVEFINLVGDYMMQSCGNRAVYCARTMNSLSIKCDGCDGTVRHMGHKRGDRCSDYIKLDFILRSYRTYSEVLHGFDVDSCCIGYDGTDIWMTERCNFALLHGYNTVNFDLMSPSYEQRLVKYATRGMSINVSNIELYKLKRSLFVDEYTTKTNISYIKKTIDICKYINKYNQTSISSDVINELCTTYIELNDPNLPASHQTLRLNYNNLNGLSYLLHAEFEYTMSLTKQSFIPSFQGESDYGNGFATKYTHTLYSKFLHYLYESRYEFLDIIDVENIDVLNIDVENIHVGIIDWDLIPSLLEPYWQTEGGELRSDFDIICNSPFVSPISVISCKLTLDRSVVDMVTISSDVYTVMNILSDVLVSREIELKVTSPSEQITGTFHKLVYDDRELWYVGPYVERK